MTKPIMVALLTCLAAVWLAASNAVILGTWKCSSETPTGQPIPWTLKVSEQDGKLVAVALSERGELPLQEPALEGDTFRFSARVGEGVYQVTVKVSGGKLEGTWKGGEETGAVKGTREP